MSLKYWVFWSVQRKFKKNEDFLKTTCLSGKVSINYSPYHIIEDTSPCNLGSLFKGKLKMTTSSLFIM